MKTWIRIAVLGIVLAGSAGMSACVSSSNASMPPGTSYVFGHLDGVMNGTPQSVVKAAKSVLEDQEMKEITEAASALDGKVTAKTALDKPISITVTKKDETSSKISIKIGSFGDHAVSVDLYGKIKSKLD